jgi:hypothetical protein
MNPEWNEIVLRRIFAPYGAALFYGRDFRTHPGKTGCSPRAEDAQARPCGKREIALMRRLCPHYHRAHATERRVSLNIVYSHLKQIREKTGCKSVPELIRKFGELERAATAELISADQCTALHTRNIPPNSTTASRIAV